MNIKTTVSAIAALLLGLCPLPAQEPAPAPQQPAVEIQLLEHPFYGGGFYPAWSQMRLAALPADTQAAMELARAQLDAICAVEPGQETWENVFAPLEAAGEELLTISTFFGHISQVADCAKVRQAQEQLVPVLTAFSAEIVSNKQLWEVVQRAAAQPWVQDLSPAKKRYIELILEGFQDSGVNLPPEQQAHLQEIVTEIAQLQLKYDANLADSGSSWHRVIKDPAELEGMPAEWLEQQAKRARRYGFGTAKEPQWLVTLDAESAGQIMRYCTVEATRKLCWEGRCSLGKAGEYDNEPIVARIMTLRQEYANLMGYANYADMACKHRMLDSGDKALAFVDAMMLKIQPAFQCENQDLLDCASRLTGTTVEALNPWDIPFYQTRLAEAQEKFDMNELRPYFRSDNVLKGIFGHFSKLYDITITELPAVCLAYGQACPEGAVEVWHPSVRVFKITDNKTGAHLGSFYLDLLPRQGKQPGAWMNPMRPGKPGKDGQPHQPHLGALVANLTPPGEEGYALYSQMDVETIFHEFGHILHSMLSDTEMHAHMGTEVELDFMELPSQINENWAWEPEVVATYAFHHQTGEPMPVELMQRFIAHRFSTPVSTDMEQLRLAKLDLEIHMHYAEKFAGRPLDEASDALLHDWQIPTTTIQPSLMREFSHSVSYGYSAGYFCYQWAEVLAADAFTRFQKEGVTNPETGASFRETILKQGSSKPADELYRDFMGRDPDPSALLERLMRK